MASLIHATAHGLSVGDRFYFANFLPTNCGVDGDTLYYVFTVPTADTFTFSADNISAFTLTYAITEADLIGPDAYTVVADGVMDPPAVPATPVAPTVGSALISGVVRLSVALAITDEDYLRAYEVQITHQFTGSAADWTYASVHTVPNGATDLNIPALGSTSYAVRVRKQDVFANFSAWSTEVDHTTLAGSDSLSAALALLANDVSDGVITTTKIADGSISTPKLQAQAVTADILAATIVLASLIKTASSGRRIEMDAFGIRLYDSTEELLVNIPTNGDPVYVKGQVNASSLISQTAATLYGTNTLPGSSITTLANGVSDPTTVPTVTASVDSLALNTTPTGVSTAAGIGYDSGAGTFWLAADPSTGYVAHEFDATTGAYTGRSITATGSTTTVTATLGSTSHVSDTADGLVGTTDSHITTPLTIPAGLSNVHITKVAVWMAGRLGTCDTRVGVWNTSNVNLRESATFSAASGGATTLGASTLHNVSLSSSLAVTAGTTYRCGFRRVNGTDGSQHDKDDGSGKTTYSGDGTTADGTGWGTRSSSSKPNVYITYTYDVDSRLETAPNIGVATDGTYIYTLDNTGVIWKYDRSTLAYVSHSAALSLTGTKALNGLFYDATAVKLVITHATGTTGTDHAKFSLVDPTALTISSTLSDTVLSINGAAHAVRGGALVADALNASAATYWVTIAGGVWAFLASTGANVSNRDFGSSTTNIDGLTHDGTVFRGWNKSTPTTIWKFSAWDFTTTSTTLWVGYAWYDSNATGGTHETAMGTLRASLTIRRHERVQVVTPTIPTGGTNDPDKVRIYLLQNATDSGAGAYWLHATDASTARYITAYTASGTHDGTGTVFPAGTPAEVKSGATGWSLKGDGTITTSGKLTTSGLRHDGGTSFPSSPSTNDHFNRTDLGMEFYWDGTRWVTVTIYYTELSPNADRNAGAFNLAGLTATNGTAARNAIMAPSWASDIWLLDHDFLFDVNAGTALSGSNKWVGQLMKFDTGGTLVNVGSAINIASGASSVWRHDGSPSSINALLTSATYLGIQVSWTKTGTPGNLLYYGRVSYRLVAT